MVIERESLAISKFKNFLWGTPFMVKSDHKPLQSVFNKKGLDLISSRIRRWVVSQQEYDFQVEYLPGCMNHTADWLSRLVGQVKSDDRTRMTGKMR